MAQNILSIDVEEILHAEYVKDSGEIDGYRSVENIELILDLLNEFDISATFFIVGEIVQSYPNLLKLIEAQGHEVSFHGWSHKPLWELDEESFRMELGRFLELHPDCIGYRAPSFSLDEKTEWALHVLDEEGFIYDSSIFPVKTPLYGVSEAPLIPYQPSKLDFTRESSSGVWEFPLLTYSLFGIRIPAAGGFYLRFMPTLIHKAIKSRNSSGFPAIIYVHSWELDPETPKYKLGLYRSFVTYYNTEKTYRLLHDLLTKYNFTSFENYLVDIESVIIDA